VRANARFRPYRSSGSGITIDASRAVGRRHPPPAAGS
jgi:hypothetical protein